MSEGSIAEGGASHLPQAIIPNVGIVGHSRAGKTAYVASLERALRRREWQVAIDPAQGKYLRNLINTLQSGHFPEPTPLQDEYEQIVIRASKGGRHFRLSLVDPAGELFEPVQDRKGGKEMERREAGRLGLQSKLSNCTGFLVLLDLECKSETFVRTLEIFLSIVSSNRRSNGNRDEEKLSRVAILFSKADLLTWQDRYRVRSAADWVEDPRNNMVDVVQLVRSNFREARFEFMSTIGWNQGMPNLRTQQIPRSFNVGNLVTDMRGEHMPDPALTFNEYSTGREDQTQYRFMRGAPIFTDPLRIAPYDLPKEEFAHVDIAGVRPFPGRRETTNTYSPWNVVEPLLWVAESQEP